MDTPIDQQVGTAGVSMPIPPTLSTSDLWVALKVKITEPNLFLPVKVLVARPSDDGKGTYREMSLGERVIKENIYEDVDALEVKFQMVGTNEEIVNAILIDPATGDRTLTFFSRKIDTKERTHWAVPKAMVQSGVAKTIEQAEKMVAEKKAE